MIMMMLIMMMMTLLTGLEREDMLSRHRPLPVYHTVRARTPSTSEDTRLRTSPAGMERGTLLHITANIRLWYYQHARRCTPPAAATSFFHGRIETCMGMEIAGILRNPRVCVAGFPWGLNKIVWDSRGNVALFDFYDAPIATKICFQTVE